MEKIEFRKHTNTETKVQILDEKRINSGTYGEIFDTVVKIGNRKKRFIIKKHELMSPENPGSAEWAFKNYKLAKEAGLRVFPTFRIADDLKSILMTTGFSENNLCVGSNNHITIDHFGRGAIQEITNIEEFLKNIFDECIKAARSSIRLSRDMSFFILSRSEPTKIDFVIGDLDNLTVSKVQDKKKIARYNLSVIQDTLHNFLEHNIADATTYWKYVAQVSTFYEKTLLDLENTDLNK